MADLLAGTKVLAADTPPAREAGDGTNISSWTNTTAANGTPVVGVAFTAPTSGRVQVSMNSALQSVSGQVFCGFIVRTGSTIGSGTTVISSENEPNAKIGTSTGTVNAGCSQVVTGLTAGASYNACAVYWAAASATGSLFHRRIDVIPTS